MTKLILTTLLFALPMAAQAKKISIEVNDVLSFSSSKAFADGSIHIKNPKLYGYPVSARQGTSEHMICKHLGNYSLISYETKYLGNNRSSDANLKEAVVAQNVGFFMTRSNLLIESVVCAPAQQRAIH